MLSKRWLTVVLICLGIFVLLALVKFFQIRAAIEFGESFPEPSETVEYQIVNHTTWQPEIDVIGEVLAPQEVALRTEVAGVISLIGFEAGARVAQGDTLLQLNVAEEQARLAALKPQMELAQKDFDRLSGIRNKQAVSQQLIDQAKSRLGVARGEVATITESIINKTVKAPFAGVTGLHDFEVGEYLPADTLVTRLVGQSDVLWVDFQLPQQHANVQIGANVEVSAERLFTGSATAVVSVVEPAFSRDSRTLGVRAVLPNMQSRLTPGSFVKVSVPTGAESSVVRLPSTAVRSDAFGNFVFLLRQDDQKKWRAAQVRVQELARQGMDSIIQPSLDIGDRVATVGAFKLRDGVWAKLAERSAPEAPIAPVVIEPANEPIDSEGQSAAVDPAVDTEQINTKVSTRDGVENSASTEETEEPEVTLEQAPADAQGAVADEMADEITDERADKATAEAAANE